MNLSNFKTFWLTLWNFVSVAVVGWPRPTAKHPHTAAHSFFPSPQWDGRENRETKKVRKLVGQSREKGEKKRCDIKWCKGNHSPPLTRRLMPNHWPPSNNLPFLAFYLSSYCWAWHHMVRIIPLATSGQLSRVPCQLPAHVLLTSWGTELGERKSLDTSRI